MWFAYFDESKEDNRHFVYSALIVDSDKWNETFEAVKNLRRQLREKYGIYIAKELHAWKFASGKGQIADHPISKLERASIFREILNFIANSGHFQLISSTNDNEFFAFDRIINRINRTAEARKTNVLLFSDEGQEAIFTRRIRKMRVFNHIPSNQGVWQSTSSSTKNIPIQNIIEDPVFKKSHMSSFIQLVDFCAYALLRMEHPIPTRTSLGYDAMYPILEPCIVQAVNPKCPKHLAIIR